MNILVSACLLGIPCRYDGRSKPCRAVTDLAQTHRLIPVCPEVLGGLPTPREPAEIQKNGQVVNRAGVDVSRQYADGAEMALRIARENGCTLAILKEKSPSCGSGVIYDGSFSRLLTGGDGICAAQLRACGIRVVGESELSALGLLSCDEAISQK